MRPHPPSLTDIERAVRDSWGDDTSTPEFRSRWSQDNRARDQCGVTALVVNDLLGGDLVRGEVHVDGERADFHWWNVSGSAWRSMAATTPGHSAAATAPMSRSAPGTAATSA
jgi:hypothetical protein